MNFLFLISFISGLAHADFAGSIANAIFQKKVDQLLEKAKSCTPLERDFKSSLDAIEWSKIQPQLPEWQKLAEIEKTAEDSRKYAQSIGGNDKILHCLAGCFIAKNLDYKSAVLVGWLKELRDASDCKKSTSFEKKDYEFTVIGAEVAKSDKDCKKVCKKSQR